MGSRFELNIQGVGELLKSPEMMGICKEYASKAQSKLGDGYEVKTYKLDTRSAAKVQAETYKARKDNAKNNTILKALRG